MTRIRRLVSSRWLDLGAPAYTAVVVTALVLPALVVKGIVATHAGGDSPFLLQRVYEMTSALSARNVPPRWLGDSAYGLGYPLWVYYGPLAYLVAGALALLGGGIVGSIKVTAALAFAVAASGAYVMAWTQWRRAPAAAMAALAYSAAPYHMVNLYVRGDALSELVGYAVLPWLLVAIDRTGRRPDGPLLLAIATAAMLTAHNITALLSLPVAALYALWRLSPWGRLDRTPKAASASDGSDRAAVGSDRAAVGPGAVRRMPPATTVAPLDGQGGWSRIPAWAARLMLFVERRCWRVRRLPGSRGALLVLSVALGAALSAWFWAPAVLQRDLVQLDANLSGYFDYRGHFVDPGRLVHLAPVFEYEIEPEYAPWRAGLVQVVVAAAGLLAGLAMPRRRGATVFWLVVVVTATWLMTARSAAVWAAVPLLAYVQFPWRWLSVQALGLAMLAAPLGAARFGRAWSAVAGLALAASVLVGLDVEPLGVRDVSAADVRAFELMSGNLGSTVRSEYLPAGVAPRPFSSLHAVLGSVGQPRAVEANDSVDQAALLRSGPAGQTWDLRVSGDGVVPVAFPTLAFGGWAARIEPREGGFVDPGITTPEGAWQQVGSVPGSGWLTVEMTPGAHVVELALGRDTIRALAEGVSLLALLLFCAVLLADRRRRLGRAVLVAVGLFALLALLARALPQASGTGPRTLDPLRSPWPRYHDEGITFAGTRLVRAELDRTSVAAGEELSLAMGWENAEPGYRVEAALVSPAEPVFLAPDVRSRSEQAQTEPMPLRLSVPRETPLGNYFVRLRVLVDDPESPFVAPRSHGRDLGTLYLGPVRVAAAADVGAPTERPVARMGDIVLDRVQAADVGRTLEVTLTWRSERLVVRDYKTSIRLLDGDGEVVVQEDKMPLYGFLPTTAWPVGPPIMDRRWLTLPDTAPSRDDYQVQVVVYDEAEGQELGQARIGGVALMRGGS